MHLDTQVHALRNPVSLVRVEVSRIGVDDVGQKWLDWPFNAVRGERAPVAMMEPAAGRCRSAECELPGLSRVALHYDLVAGSA